MKQCQAPQCEAPARSRGLCKKCIDKARYLVDTGQTTWEQLERTGKCLPPTKRGGRNITPRTDALKPDIPRGEVKELLDAIIRQEPMGSPLATRAHAMRERHRLYGKEQYNMKIHWKGSLTQEQRNTIIKSNWSPDKVLEYLGWERVNCPQYPPKEGRFNIFEKTDEPLHSKENLVVEDVGVGEFKQYMGWLLDKDVKWMSLPNI